MLSVDAYLVFERVLSFIQCHKALLFVVLLFLEMLCSSLIRISKRNRKMPLVEFCMSSPKWNTDIIISDE